MDIDPLRDGVVAPRVMEVIRAMPRPQFLLQLVEPADDRIRRPRPKSGISKQPPLGAILHQARDDLQRVVIQIDDTAERKRRDEPFLDCPAKAPANRPNRAAARAGRWPVARFDSPVDVRHREIGHVEVGPNVFGKRFQELSLPLVAARRQRLTVAKGLVDDGHD